jgi:hypothetical protein
MAGYKIEERTLSEYFNQHRKDITADEGWGHKDNEIIARAKEVAPDVPVAVLRKAYLKAKKTWMNVDEDLFAKNFTVK